MARLRRPASHLQEVCLIFEDKNGHNMKDLFSLSETRSSLRFSWLHQALEFTEEEAKEKEEQCHITMMELLGSLHTIILDVEGKSLSCIKKLKDKAVFIVSWRWKHDCDGSCQKQENSTALKKWVPLTGLD